MNSQKMVIEEKRYYKGKYLNSIKYENGNLYTSINDSNLYVLSKKNAEDSLQLFYFNKLLVEKKFFNTHNDLVRDIIYGIDSLTNKDSLLKEYVYKYKNNKIVSESCYINKEMEYNMDYKYNNEGRLVEKNYSFERCCDKGQPIPNDKVIYKYDVSGNLIREDYIIDRSITKEYKNKFEGYFDQVKTIEYSYDDKNRLTNKILYKENYSSNPSIPIDSLLNPKIIDKDYKYLYSPAILRMYK